MEPDVEHRELGAAVCDAVPMALRHALDQTMETQAP